MNSTCFHKFSGSTVAAILIFRMSGMGLAVLFGRILQRCLDVSCDNVCVFIALYVACVSVVFRHCVSARAPT